MPSWPEVFGTGRGPIRHAARMPRGFAPLHVVRALPRRTLGVLTPLMELATLAVFYPGQARPLGRAITLSLSRDDSPWHGLPALEQLAEKLLRRLRIAAARHEKVKHVLVLIDGPPQGMPCTIDCEEALVQRPCVQPGPCSRRRSRFASSCPKLPTPLADGCVGHRDAAFEQALCHAAVSSGCSDRRASPRG